ARRAARVESLAEVRDRVGCYRLVEAKGRREAEGVDSAMVEPIPPADDLSHRVPESEPCDGEGDSAGRLRAAVSRAPRARTTGELVIGSGSTAAGRTVRAR